MKLPLLSELEVEQLDVYTHPANKSVIVVGPPGSGKTTLAIWRALFVARQGQNVVLITRNRMLAAMARQLASEGEGGSFVTTTMQSFVWQDCIEAIKEPPNGGNGDYTIDWPKISKKFRAQGVKRRIDHLIVDEGQNLPAGFFIWANEFCSPTMSIFADEHQTTVDEGSTMQDLRKLGIPDWLRLMFNHRNTEEIARLSGWFHKDRMLPQTIARRGSSGDVPRVIEVVGSAWDDLAQMAADRLSNVGGSIGVITYEQNDVEAIYAAIRNVAPGLRVDRYHSGKPKGAENFRIRDDGVTVLSSESAIGLEFDTVFLQDLSRSLPSDNAVANRRLYMLTARARDRLSLVNGPRKLKPAQLDSLPSLPYLVR